MTAPVATDRRPATGRRRHPWRRRMLGAVAAAMAVALLVVAAVAVLWPLTPSVADAESRIATRLAAHHAADPHALPQPDRVGQAVIATENSRFYRDRGIDILGVARAAYGFLSGSPDPGGATLEQQLAKNLYTPHRTGVAAKLEQVELALKLDRRFTKAQVLEMYLSAVYFGHGFYGLPAAARGYFGRAPNQLSWAQASLLAGLVQAPSAYDPYAHRDLARRRQRHVLDRLVATQLLTRAQADAVFRQPWQLVRG